MLQQPRTNVGRICKSFCELERDQKSNFDSAEHCVNNLFHYQSLPKHPHYAERCLYQIANMSTTATATALACSEIEDLKEAAAATYGLDKPQHEPG